MDLGQSLHAELSGHAGLTALVSTNIYPSVVPSTGSLPAVTYQRISRVPVHAMGGDAVLNETRYQVSSWSADYNVAQDVAAQIIAALRDFSGQLGGVGGVMVQRIFFHAQKDLHDLDSVTGEVTSYHVALDFNIWAEE